MSAAIRSGRMSDIDALVAIERRAFAGDRISRRSFRHFLASPTCSLLVAASGDAAILGYALVLFRRGSRRARLYSIAVDPSRGTPGLGQALLEAAEDAARRAGATELRLEVRQDNARAISLYEKVGYRVFDERPGYYEDGAVAQRYAKQLDKGRAHI